MNVHLPALALLSWAALSAWAAQGIAQRLADEGGGHRLLALALALLVLVPLPLIDELLARPQFEALCRERVAAAGASWRMPLQAVQRLDLPAQGLPGFPLPVRVQRSLYLDGTTRQLVASVDALEAGPGRLARLTGQAHGPITFSGACPPAALRGVNPAAPAPAGPSPAWSDREPQSSAPAPTA